MIQIKSIAKITATTSVGGIVLLIAFEADGLFQFVSGSEAAKAFEQSDVVFTIGSIVVLGLQMAGKLMNFMCECLYDAPLQG